MNYRDWKRECVLIVGFSNTGISVARYLRSLGAKCFITEKNSYRRAYRETLEELKSLGVFLEFGGHSDEFIEKATICVLSPSVRLDCDIVKILRQKNIEILSEIDLSQLQCADTKFIDITGTNGKTTVTYLCEHILNVKYRAKACGNIGIAPCQILFEKKCCDYFVCELSSYQIASSNHLKPFIACFLTFTPDHLDWHKGLDNYFKAKTKLFELNKPKFAVFNWNDEKIRQFGQLYNGEKFFFDKKLDQNCCYIEDGEIYFQGKAQEKREQIINLKDLRLVGHHNYQNVMCAVIVSKLVGVDSVKIGSQLKSFECVEHRIEYVAKLNGSIFYNDSKATNPEASIVAIDSFQGKSLTLIAGGRDKNTNLNEFVQCINKNVQNVILLGEAKERFRENILKSGFKNIYTTNTLNEAIEKSIELGDEIVLFSPACSSFDMFENFEKRGEAFKSYVRSKLLS